MSTKVRITETQMNSSAVPSSFFSATAAKQNMSKWWNVHTHVRLLEVCVSSRIHQTASSSASGGSSFSSSWMTSSHSSTLLWQCQTDTKTATSLTSLSLSLPLFLSLSVTADWDHAADECVFQCHPSPARERGRCGHYHNRKHRGGIPSPGLHADAHPPGAALTSRLRWTPPHNPPPSSSTWPLRGPAPVLRTPRLLHWERHGSQNKESAVFTPHPWK